MMLNNTDATTNSVRLCFMSLGLQMYITCIDYAQLNTLPLLSI